MTTGTSLATRPTREKGRALRLAAAELSSCEPAEVAAAGYERIQVEGPVVAGETLDEDLRLLRFLREATSHTLRMDWELAGRPLVEPRNLTHLVPPVRGTGPVAAAWRAAYRYGTFHYRCGPGFVTVKDIRPDGDTVHLTVDGVGAEQFRVLAEATRLAELDPAATEALDDAVDYGLALRGSETLLLLPFRMRRWPVPYTAV